MNEQSKFDTMYSEIMTSRTSQEATPYAVRCPKHGRVFLTQAEYTRQMCIANELWICPLCNRSAQFDDDNYESFVEADEQASDDAHRAELEAEAEYAEQQKAEAESRYQQEQEDEGRARYEQEQGENYFDPGPGGEY